MTPRPPLVAIVGPTASGKSSLAIFLAERFQGEILNCDSLQMVRGFDVGTAKPSPADRARLPHHLIDILDPEEQFSAGEFARRAREVLAEVTARARLPVVAGGTGLYLRALLDGLFPGPARDPALRQRLREGENKKGAGYLHRLLTRLDPATAARIHPHDVPKTIRAIEVCLLGGERMSEQFQRGRDALEGYAVIKVGLDPPRNELYERINQRAAAMFERGLVEEVSGLLEKGCPAFAPPFQAHGYREALDYLLGRISRRDAIYQTQAATRHYAKRQLTWFRKEAGIEWFAGFGDDPAAQAAISRYVAQRLESRG